MQYQGNELEIAFKNIHWKKYFRRFIDMCIKGDVLEVGAGIGGTTRVTFSNTVRSWTCLEPDPKLFEQLKENLYEVSKKIEYCLGTINELPTERKFDTILYIDVLEHIEGDAEEVLNAAKRLREKGTLIVLSPAHNFLYSPFDRAIGHVRRYSKQTLRLTAPSSLQIVDLRYLGSVAMIGSLGNKYIVRGNNPTEAQMNFWDNILVPPSRIVDAITRYRLGKSILGIWRKPTNGAEGGS